MPYSTISREPFQVEQHRTLEETTYRYLRAAIVAGDLAPSAKLIGSRLAVELNVSRITIANALKRLISEGFVVGAPHREATVASLDETSLREIFLTRYALEEVVMREVVRHITPEVLDQLRAIDAQLRLSITEQDVAAYRRLERDYHLLIYATSALPMISALLSDLWDRLEPYRGRRFNKLQLSYKAVAEHDQIVNALAARDSTKLISAMRAHVDHGYERFRQALTTATVLTETETSVLRRTVKADHVPAPAGSLRAAFDALADKRRGQGKVHSYGSILALAVCAMLCGVRCRYGVAQWGQHCHPTIREALGLRHDRGPSAATIHRAFRDLDHATFTAVFQQWFTDYSNDKGVMLDDALALLNEDNHDQYGLPGVSMVTNIAARICTAWAAKCNMPTPLDQALLDLPMQLLAGTATNAPALLAQQELVRYMLAQGVRVSPNTKRRQRYSHSEYGSHPVPDQPPALSHKPT